VPEAFPERPNIVVISADGMRLDRTHFGGNRRPSTPSLDALVANGAYFPNAFSQSNESLLSHGALFTGRYPSEIGRPDYLTLFLPDEALLLSEAVTAVGYESAAFVAGGHVKAAFGFDQGYARFFEGRDFGSFHETGPAATAWLSERSAQGPFFLFLHGYDCHRPYLKTSVFYHPFDTGFLPVGLDALIAKRNFSEYVYDGVIYADYELGRIWHSNGERMLNPDAYLGLPEYAAAAGADALTYKLRPDDLGHILAHYDGSVLMADTFIGLFLESLVELGLWESTVVIVLGDHGEDLQDHGFYNHRSVIFDSTTRVPFVLGGGALPAAWRGTTHYELVDAVDLAPTVMDLAGSVAPAGSRGRSVVALLDGQPVAPKPMVFQQGVLGQSSVRTATHRLVFRGLRLTDERYLETLATAPIDGGHFALYESFRDSRERQDILARAQPLAEQLRGAMVDWYGELQVGTAAESMSPELRKMMQDRGYW